MQKKIQTGHNTLDKKVLVKKIKMKNLNKFLKVHKKTHLALKKNKKIWKWK